MPSSWPDFTAVPFPQPKIGVPFHIPSDPKATYTILAVSGPARERLVWTLREGPSGVLYTLHVYDCEQGTFRQLHEGESLDSLPLSVPSEMMAELQDGSIKWFMWRAVKDL